jgi:spore coat polysaccharide biosynthesis protein SpsF
MVDHVVDRTQRASVPDEVVLAIPEGDRDDPLHDHAASLDVPVHRGSEGDVLDRYHDVVRERDTDIVVRITADCPLIDPGVVDRVAQTCVDTDADYLSNTLEPTYPAGLCTEAFDAETLNRTWTQASDPEDREGVTPFIKRHPSRFDLRNVAYYRDFSDIRLTVDWPKDLERVRRVHNKAENELRTLDDILEVLDAHPGILDS